MTRFRLALAAAVLSSLGSAGAAPLRDLAVHYAARAERSPTVDGRLDEPCWEAAPAFIRYRHVYGERRQETSSRILWNAEGLYIGVVNAESDPGRMRTTVRTRDGANIWADDSAELYIDPSATGYGMCCFHVNALGTIGDYRQVDPGFTDYSWSARSVRAASGRTAGAWTIEFFVSWEDLGRTPAAGDVWMFFHVRFSYTAPDGARSADSSSGGVYFDRTFGFLCFCDRTPPPPESLGRKLASVARPPWVSPVDGRWLLGEAGAPVVLASGDALAADFKARAEKAIAAAAAAGGAGDALAKLRGRLGAAAGAAPGFERMAALRAVAEDARTLLDETELAAFIEASREKEKK